MDTSRSLREDRFLLPSNSSGGLVLQPLRKQTPRRYGVLRGLGNRGCLSSPSALGGRPDRSQRSSGLGFVLCVLPCLWTGRGLAARMLLFWTGRSRGAQAGRDHVLLRGFACSRESSRKARCNRSKNTASVSRPWRNCSERGHDLVSSQRMVLRRYIPTVIPDLSDVATCRSTSDCDGNTRSPHRPVLEGRCSLGRSLATLHLHALLGA